MEKISVNSEEFQSNFIRSKLLRQALKKEEILKTIKTKRKSRQGSCDFNNLGLKQFLPKNVSFSPLSRPSDLKFGSKTMDKQRKSKDLEEKMKEIIAKITQKKISVCNN